MIEAQDVVVGLQRLAGGEQPAGGDRGVVRFGLRLGVRDAVLDLGRVAAPGGVPAPAPGVEVGVAVGEHRPQRQRPVVAPRQRQRDIRQVAATLAVEDHAAAAVGDLTVDQPGGRRRLAGVAAADDHRVRTQRGHQHRVPTRVAPENDLRGVANGDGAAPRERAAREPSRPQRAAGASLGAARRAGDRGGQGAPRPRPQPHPPTEATTPTGWPPSRRGGHAHAARPALRQRLRAVCARA